jgi:hypothetical protein
MIRRGCNKSFEVARGRAQDKLPDTCTFVLLDVGARDHLAANLNYWKYVAGFCKGIRSGYLGLSQRCVRQRSHIIEPPDHLLNEVIALPHNAMQIS